MNTVEKIKQVTNTERIKRLENKLQYAYFLIQAYEDWFSYHKLWCDDFQIKEMKNKFLEVRV